MQIILTILGACNAIYLLYLHLNTTVGCGIGESCRTVLASSYASLAGVPVAALGVGLYLALLLLTLLSRESKLTSRQSVSLRLLLLTPAAATGIVLFATQFLYIHAFCPFCSLNSLILLILFVGAFMDYRQNPGFELGLAPSQWVALFAVGLLPVAAGVSFGSQAQANYIIGEFSGNKITTYKLMDSDLANDWRELQFKQYNLKKNFFNEQVLNLHAANQGLSVSAYIQKNIRPTIQISEEEMKAFYEERKADIPKDKTYDDVKNSIRNYLARLKEGDVLKSHVDGLYGQYDARLLTQMPVPFQIKKNELQSFSKGNLDAPIKIIEFADLECGACKRAYVQLKSILDTLGDKVYFEYRHFPLGGHQYSKLYAKGSVCAGEQERFFDYVEVVFANQEKLSRVTPKDLSDSLGLDAAAFDACMAKSYAQYVVEEDVKEANRLGIQSTPTFFINGQIFVGIPSLSDINDML